MFKISFLTLLSWLKHSMIKYEISVSDLSNLQIFRIWNILVTPGERTMHPGKLIMGINVVLNNISGNFYFDHKAARSNLTEQFFYSFFITPRGCFRGDPGWKICGSSSGDIQRGLKSNLCTNLYDSSFKITGYPYHCFYSLYYHGQW